MRSIVISCVLLSAVAGLAACGGGGYTAPAAAPVITPMPTPAPTTAPTAPPAATTPTEATLLGSAGFVAPTAGVALSAGFAVFTRSDNAAAQLEYQGHPLYTFSGDSAAGTTNGNGLVSFGGTWSLARP